MDTSLLYPTARTIGLLASGILFLAFVLYTFLYVILVSKVKLPPWQSIAFLADEVGKPWFRYFTVCQVLTLIAGLAYLALVCVIFSAAGPAHIIFATISLVSATIFILLSSEHYFVQLTYVKTRLVEKRLDGLEEYSQLYGKSMIISKNILGWTLFFGISTLSLIPLFASPGLGVSIQIVLLLNSIFCLLGLIGYAWNKMVLNVLFFNGMGLAVILMGGLAFFYFM